MKCILLPLDSVIVVSHISSLNVYLKLTLYVKCFIIYIFFHSMKGISHKHDKTSIFIASLKPT